ncbi:MAG: hypothetical protein ACUVQ3_01325 [bacterium]
MGKVLILLLALSLIVERVTEKILHIIPPGRNQVYSWIISTALGLVISFAFQFGFIRELGLNSGSDLSQWVDYLITGLLIACGSEPIHSIVDGLAYKRDELKRKAKNV